MGDRKGVYAVIDFKAPDEPNKGLGYRICTYGNQDHTHEAIMKDRHDLYVSISSSQLTEKEVGQVLYQYLVPKLEYGTR